MSDHTYDTRRARRLKNLRIDSVDSVDRGAGRGVQVLLMKRDARRDDGYAWASELAHRQFQKRQQQATETYTMSISELVTKTERMRADGQISDYSNALLHQAIATEMFPEAPNVGVALAKFYGTAIGKRALQGATSKSYEEIQKRSALGNAYDVLLKQSGDDTADDDEGARDTGSEIDGPEGTTEGQAAPTSKWLKQLDDQTREFMGTPDGKAMTFQQAFTHCATKTDSGIKALAAHNAHMMNRHAAGR